MSLSKKGKREITAFMGHELIYDFMTEKLDDERRKAVVEHLKYSRDAQLDLAKVQAGDYYAGLLSKTKVSKPIIDQINMSSTYFSTLMQKTHFDKWPQGLKWGLEALVVISGIVLLLTLLPWQKVITIGSLNSSQDLILAEANHSESAIREVDQRPQFDDEYSKPGSQTLNPGSQVLNPLDSSIKVQEKNKEFKVVETKGSTVPTPAIVSSIEKKEEVKSVESAAGFTGGFLYRGEASIANLTVVGPKITEKISELGGRKAGSVDLGWSKEPGSMYYHFTMPEAKYEEFYAFLSTYGRPRLAKDKHPRIMPDGIVRIILTLDEPKK